MPLQERNIPHPKSQNPMPANIPIQTTRDERYTKLQPRNPKGKERKRKRRENTIIEYELYSTIG
jgi:hypothetical protein